MRNTNNEERKEIPNTVCYLKSASIELPEVENSWLFFNDFSVMVNIHNENIEPQASRSKLIELSEHYVMRAIEITKYLWLLNELKGEGDNANANTISFPKKSIKDLWDNKNPLLRRGMKPK